MRKRSRKNRQFGLLRSSLYLCIAIAIKIGKRGGFILGYAMVEICFWLMIFGIGLFYDITDYTIFALLIIVFALLVIFYNWQKSKKLKRGRVKLAFWITQIFVDRESPEWAEYQDWLHDILLARRQLLDAKCPKWKVTIITYWRLSAFLIIVSLSKIKSLAVSVMKLR